MHHLRLAALGAVVGAALAATAGAAAAQPADVGWTGPYVGVELGGRWSNADGRVNSATNNGANILAPGSSSHSIGDSSSFRGGIYGGYDWRVAPQWVLGVEADWAWGENDRTLAHAIYPGNASFVTGRPDDSFTVKQNWDASLRARAGFLVEPTVLIYATGGVAWTDVQTRSVCGVLSDCRPGVFAKLFAPAIINNTQTPTGWTLGGGAEWNVAPGWLVRGEYRYADYGWASDTETRITPAGPTTQVVNFSTHVTSSTVSVGVAYRF